MRKPIDWPDCFPFSSRSISIDVDENMLRECLSTGNEKDFEICSSLIEKEQVYPGLKIKKIISPHHPLYAKEVFQGHPQHGLFASHKIPANVELGEYVGEIRLGSISQYDGGVYCWVVSVHNFIIQVDSRRLANELSFVNDYRGIASAPNVHTALIVHKGSYYFGYKSIREIASGEELLTDYGQRWAINRDSFTSRDS